MAEFAHTYATNTLSEGMIGYSRICHIQNEEVYEYSWNNFKSWGMKEENTPSTATSTILLRAKEHLIFHNFYRAYAKLSRSLCPLKNQFLSKRAFGARCSNLSAAIVFKLALLSI